jgi:acetyl-CoA synthetase
VECQSVDCPTADTVAEDPLMLIYTSGTTGKPKSVVHTHCGFLVKAAQDMALGTDVHPGVRSARSPGRPPGSGRGPAGR